jgi:hypothetical protein
MPSVPLYAHRLAEAMAVLESMTGDWIDRRTLGEILAVSKWTAWRILKACGAQEGPGGALAIRRAELIERLGALRENGRLAPEIARRARLESALDGIVRFARSRRREIARNERALSLVSTRCASLPPGVTLTPDSLAIEFQGMEDFLGKFGAVVYALHNDYESISEFIEGGSNLGNRARSHRS